jgi:hypothetical protein
VEHDDKATDGACVSGYSGCQSYHKEVKGRHDQGENGRARELAIAVSSANQYMCPGVREALLRSCEMGCDVRCVESKSTLAAQDADREDTVQCIPASQCKQVCISKGVKTDKPCQDDPKSVPSCASIAAQIHIKTRECTEKEQTGCPRTCGKCENDQGYGDQRMLEILREHRVARTAAYVSKSVRLCWKACEDRDVGFLSGMRTRRDAEFNSILEEGQHCRDRCAKRV